jgi:leucyl/phenylalanyl-tRNA---protein transferase
LPIYLLNEDPDAFPDPERAHPSGVVAVGGDLTVERLLAAYKRGIFPWYGEGDPILWHSPDPRFALVPDELHVPRSLEKVIKRGAFELKLDTVFEEVIGACARAPRPGQSGTWLTAEMRDAYCELHRSGYAHSAEAWQAGTLVGGLYGVALGSVFFGESMFATVPDASKATFVVLARQLAAWRFSLIDCQQETAHLARFGATPWPRKRFLAALKAGLREPTRRGPWSFDAPPAQHP